MYYKFFKANSRRKGTSQSLLLNLFLILFAFLASSNDAFSQSEDYVQDWRFIGESDYQVDVSYAVISCNDNAPQIYLQVFNEHAEAQSSSFTISISDSGQSTVVHNFSAVELDLAEMLLPNCANDIPELTLAVPDGFDASSLSVEVAFN